MNPNPHELAADDVLAVVAHDKQAWEDASYVQGLRPAHMPTPQHEAVFQAISDLYRAGEVVTDISILDKTGSGVTVQWLTQRLSLYYTVDGVDVTRVGAAFEKNVRIVKDRGLTVKIAHTLGVAKQQLQEGKSRQQVIENLMTVLALGGDADVIERERADQHGADIERMFTQEPPRTVSTGLKWLDTLTGGFGLGGRMWWIVAAYKQRKTTLMLNLVLNALKNGARPAVLSREMPRERIAVSLIAMLAIEYMLDKGSYWLKDKLPDGTEVPMHWISVSSLMRSGKWYKRWAQPKVDAVDYAIAQYKKMGGLRVYDSAPRQGALGDYESALRVMRRDISVHGGDVFFADYLQLFGKPGAKIFDKVADASQALQHFAVAHSVPLVILAQQNESKIGEGLNTGYSPGVKGGGDPAATADYLLVTSYRKMDEGDEDKKLRLTMQLSRWSDQGADVYKDYDIHAGSGLIIPDEYIRTADLNDIGADPSKGVVW